MVGVFFSTGVLEHQLTAVSGVQWVKGICQERCHGTADTADGSYGMSYSWKGAEAGVSV